MKNSLVHKTILERKAALAERVSPLLRHLGERCAPLWHDPSALDQALAEARPRIPHCEYLYAWNRDGREVSSLIGPHGADPAWRGRDLSERPYLRNNLPFKGIMLSSVYASLDHGRQCVTALQAVNLDDRLLGFIAADFPLDRLLAGSRLTPMETDWRQFRGDPAVRGTLFMQTRAPSLLDRHVDAVHQRIASLMTHHGVFHMKIHYASGRCSLWFMDDPYSYRILDTGDTLNPDLCLSYPLCAYPERAKLDRAAIPGIFAQFKALRFADDTIYLRSASLNTINGMVGLTFSCDGSHYMPAAEFLARDLSFWFGEAAAAEADVPAGGERAAAASVVGGNPGGQ